MLFFLTIALYGGVHQTSDGTESNTIIVPRVYKSMEMKTSISLSFTRLPIDWVETTVDAPIIRINNKLGLASGFTLESSFESIYVSNQFRAGPHWNAELGKFSFSAGLDAGLLYGKMQIAGFNNKVSGWMLYPVVSVGFRVNQLAFTLSGERNTLQSLKISSGNAEISEFRNLKSGQTISLYMEQKLWNKHVMAIGLLNNFQKFFFPAWPAFTAFNKRYYIPQLFIGLVL